MSERYAVLFWLGFLITGGLVVYLMEWQYPKLRESGMALDLFLLAAVIIAIGYGFGLLF